MGAIALLQVGYRDQKPGAEAIENDGMIAEEDFVPAAGSSAQQGWEAFVENVLNPIIDILDEQPDVMIHHPFGVWAGSGFNGGRMGIDGALRCPKYLLDMSAWELYANNLYIYIGSPRYGMSTTVIDKCLAPITDLSLARVQSGLSRITIYLDGSAPRPELFNLVKNSKSSRMLYMGVEAYSPDYKTACFTTRYGRRHPEIQGNPNTIWMEYGPQKEMSLATDINIYCNWVAGKRDLGFTMGIDVRYALKKFGVDGLRKIWTAAGGNISGAA